jgi:hypothetical protein
MAWQRQVAEADAKIYGMMSEHAASNLDDLKGLAAKTSREISEREGDVKKLGGFATAVNDCVAKIAKGEDVPGLLRKQMTREHMMKMLGLTKADVEHMIRVSAIADAGAWDEILAEMNKRREKLDKAVVRAVAKRHGL